MVAYNVSPDIHRVTGIIDNDIVVRFQFPCVYCGITASTSAGTVAAIRIVPATAVIASGGVHGIELENRVHRQLVCTNVNNFRKDTGFCRNILRPVCAFVVSPIDGRGTCPWCIIVNSVPEQRVIVRHNIVLRHVLHADILCVFVVDNDVVTQDQPVCVAIQYGCKHLILKILLESPYIHNLLKNTGIFLYIPLPLDTVVAAMVHRKRTGTHPEIVTVVHKQRVIVLYNIIGRDIQNIQILGVFIVDNDIVTQH